jgi:hypothetical protein
MQLLPESSMSIIKYLTALVSFIPSGDELELNVGMPKF